MDIIIRNGITIINMGNEKNVANKYGVPGVSVSKGMYKVEIQFDNTKYYLGLVKTIDEAKALRTEAELHISDNTFNSWHKALLQPKNKYGVKGLHYREDSGLFYLNITYENKKYYIGRYKTIEEATEIRAIADRKIENGSFLGWIESYRKIRKNKNN